VDVFYNGTWGRICYNNWDINDAKVVCRQLGYQYPVASLLIYVNYNEIYRQIWLDKVACTGNEQSLANCPHAGWGNHSCPYYYAAGVKCSATGKVIICFLITFLKQWHY
jgi:hypothetical protein